MLIGHFTPVYTFALKMCRNTITPQLLCKCLPFKCRPCLETYVRRISKKTRANNVICILFLPGTLSTLFTYAKAELVIRVVENHVALAWQRKTRMAKYSFNFRLQEVARHLISDASRVVIKFWRMTKIFPIVFARPDYKRASRFDDSLRFVLIALTVDIYHRWKLSLVETVRFCFTGLRDSCCSWRCDLF